MGMFDYITCEYPIDAPEGLQFQTKDTDEQYLENYKIDRDGVLWHERREYKFEADNTKEGMMRFCGALKTVKKDWIKLDKFRGAVRFYTDHEGEWFEFSALFDKGKVISIERIKQ